MSRRSQQRKLHKQQPLQVAYRAPGVDIVTPVYGGAKMLHNMLESLLATEAGIPWRLWLVDDCGPEREELDKLYAEFQKKDPRIRAVRSLRNGGFAASNNRGFRQGSAALLLMLNSDILVTGPGWLKVMADEFADPQVGIVGARLLYFEDYEHPDPERPPGKTQHAGVCFNMDGNPYHIFMGWDPEHPKVNVRREMNAVTGACLMTRRALYEQLGGLDEDYAAGNFEDVQLCLQVRAMGYKVIYQPKARLYHYSGGSGNSATARFNNSLFRLKCSKIIEYDEWRFF